jgi:L-lactate utilization protein LutB
MNEVLENYKNVLYLQFVSTTMYSPDKNETEAYLFKLQEDETAQERLDILEQISKALNNKDSMLVMFDELMKPLLQSANGGTDIDKKMMEKRRELYMKSRIKDAREETLYNLKDFSIEELDELLTIVKTSSVQREVKVVYAATAYALKEFFLSMASRYDISKHDPSKYNKTSKETNNTK